MHDHKKMYGLIPAFLLFFCAGAFSAGGVDPSNPPPGVFFEQYYSIYLNNAKCGWSWYQIERRKDQIHTRNTMLIKVGREGLVFQIDTRDETTETVDGKPVGFRAERNISGSKTVFEGRFDGFSGLVKITASGRTLEHQITLRKDAVMVWGDLLRTRTFLGRPGGSFTSYVYTPQVDALKAIPMAVKVHGKATLEIQGKTIKGIKTVTTANDLGGFPIVSYFDDGGYVLATETRLGILNELILAVPKAEAISGIQPEISLANTYLALDKPLKLAPRGTMRYSITSTSKEPVPEFPDTGMQKVLERRPDRVLLAVTADPRERFPAGTPKPTAANLASSSFANLSDPLLIQLADKAAGVEKDPARLAAGLCDFVHDYIAEKNYASAFNSASETARSKSGDCSEHGVLLAALARIKNIPSRVVSGLGYTEHGGPHGSFGYHMWTQLWVNDRWTDFDSAFGQSEPDPTHIAFATVDLAEDTFFKQAARFAAFVGHLKITPVEK